MITKKKFKNKQMFIKKKKIIRNWTITASCIIYGDYFYQTGRQAISL